ncbi:MAG: hypothetical protein IKX70_02135 [Treponema sp.]|nr:hypothetical protein [Treponema sp.]
MNKPIFLCKTDADFILKTFCFKDGIAYFYGKIKDGVIKYYVHDAQGESGPFKTKPHINFYGSTFIHEKPRLEISIKDFKWKVDEENDSADDKKPMTQDEISQILNAIAQADEEDSDEADSNNNDQPESEYDEETHILRYPKKDSHCEDYFVTDSKKYGPYDIYFGAYKDDNNFQFVYNKGGNCYSDRKMVYNYNGQEFELGKSFPRIFYDIDGHAICDNLDKNYFYIDGVKTDYFNGMGTDYNYNKDENHTLIAATTTYDKGTIYYLLDGEEHYINIKGNYLVYKAEGIYYRTTDFGLETHYYNETPISVPVPSSFNEFDFSYIIGSGVSYNLQSIPQILLEGKTYNGITCWLDEEKQGFIYLYDGALYFQEYKYAEINTDDVLENLKSLYDNHRLAGE